MVLLSSSIQKGQDGRIETKNPHKNAVQSAFTGIIKGPSPTTRQLSDWTMHIWFESNIEKVDFTVLNAAVVRQNDRTVLTIVNEVLGVSLFWFHFKLNDPLR